jgi:hypothetical protein
VLREEEGQDRGEDSGYSAQRWCFYLRCHCTCWRPVISFSLSPGHTPKMVPTEKLVSTMEDPSAGWRAPTSAWHRHMLAYAHAAEHPGR